MLAQSSEFRKTLHLVLTSIENSLRQYAQDHEPYEAVALIGTQGSLYPLINQRRSAHEFMVSSTLITEGIQWLRGRQEQPLALFHSHPTTKAKPSEADKAMMEQSKVPFVILGVDRTAAFMWHDGDVVELTEVTHVEHPATDRA